MYDLLIVGGGPAGMTAAVYAARKKMDTLLITKEFGGQPMWTMEIENYMGYQFVTGPELMAKFEEQVQRFSTPIKYEEINKLVRNDDGTFTAIGSEGEYQAKAVIIASGKRPRLLNVPGEKEFTGRGVSYCATCDGPLFAGKTVAVIGSGNSAVQAAIELGNIAEAVYIVVRKAYRADEILLEKMKKLDTITEVIGYVSQEIIGEQFVEKLVIASTDGKETKELAVQGVFVEIGLMPNSEFIAGMVQLNQIGEVQVDCHTKTGIPGIFAAGDVNDGPDKQIVIAAGDGAKAALMAYDYLLRT